MKEIIATIRLAGGQVGFYDQLTGIYLTQTQPVAHLYAGMNLNQIKKSLKSKRIHLISGSIDNSSLPIMKKIEKKAEIEIKPKEKKEDKQIEPILTPNQEPVVETEKEATVEETVEVAIEETPVLAEQDVTHSRRKKRKAIEKTEEEVSPIKTEE